MNPAAVPQPVEDVQGDGRWLSQVLSMLTFTLYPCVTFIPDIFLMCGSIRNDLHYLSKMAPGSWARLCFHSKYKSVFKQTNVTIFVYFDSDVTYYWIWEHNVDLHLRSDPHSFTIRSLCVTFLVPTVDRRMVSVSGLTQIHSHSHYTCGQSCKINQSFVFCTFLFFV